MSDQGDSIPNFQIPRSFRKADTVVNSNALERQTSRRLCRHAKHLPDGGVHWAGIPELSDKTYLSEGCGALGCRFLRYSQDAPDCLPRPGLGRIPACFPLVSDLRVGEGTESEDLSILIFQPGQGSNRHSAGANCRLSSECAQHILAPSLSEMCGPTWQTLFSSKLSTLSTMPYFIAGKVQATELSHSGKVPLAFRTSFASSFRQPPAYYMSVSLSLTGVFCIITSASWKCAGSF